MTIGKETPIHRYRGIPLKTKVYTPSTFVPSPCSIKWNRSGTTLASPQQTKSKEKMMSPSRRLNFGARPPSTDSAGSNMDEISRDQAISNLLLDNRISDLKLEGLDGTVVANKSLIAARSPVLRGLLFDEDGNDRTDSSVLRVDYSYHVLRAMVDYIYTDDGAVFHDSASDASTEESIPVAPTIVSLVDAAARYQLPKLRAKAEQHVETILSQNPLVAIPIMLACQNHEGETISMVQDRCHHVIRSCPRIFLQASKNGGDEQYHLGLLSISQLKSILQDDLFQGDELTLFFLLQTWANYCKVGQEQTNVEESKQDLTANGSRTQSAQELAQYIRLELIDPIELSHFVSTSGLIPIEQLCKAYETQAVAARRKHSIPGFNLPRFVETNEENDDKGKKDETHVIPRQLFNESNQDGDDITNSNPLGILKLFCPPLPRLENTAAGCPPLPRFENTTAFCPPLPRFENTTAFCPPLPRFENPTAFCPPLPRMEKPTAFFQKFIPVATDKSNIDPSIAVVDETKDDEQNLPGVEQDDSEVVVFETDDDEDADNNDDADDDVKGKESRMPWMHVDSDNVTPQKVVAHE